MNTQNNLNKKDTQKRIIFATVLSFIFFIAYDYLYIKPQQEQMQAQKVKVEQQTQSSQQTPEVAKNAAPTTVSAVNNNVPTATLNDEGIISTIVTNKSIVKIDSLGRVAQVTLTEHQYITEEGAKIDLFDLNQLRPLEVRFADRGVNNEAFKTPFSASASTVNAKTGAAKVVLTQKLTSTTVTKVLTFYPDGHYDIDVNVANGFDYFISSGFRPNVLVDMYADHGALLKLNDNTLTIVEDEDLEKTETFTGVKIASAFDRYYATVLYNFEKSMQVSLMPSRDNSPEIFIHGRDALSLKGYMGPKEFKTLEGLNPELTDVIEYGWFTFIAKPMFLMLQYVHTLVGNWGWTIVILTIMIKLILFPLAHKGMVSMNRLKDLAPKIKAIQEKYKDDKQKASMHMMELYKKEGANPMGGCLPIILQIPVFFAIYRVLLNAIELKGAEWMLWIKDLAEMDPYFILPILMGATMFLQQRITPNTIQDPMQKKMFQYLPVIFTFFFLWFPAGLTLYWFINNLFTVSHQYYINRVFEKNKIQRHEEHLKSKHKKD